MLVFPRLFSYNMQHGGETYENRILAVAGLNKHTVIIIAFLYIGPNESPHRRPTGNMNFFNPSTFDF